jgi:hypothetical protein
MSVRERVIELGAERIDFAILSSASVVAVAAYLGFDVGTRVLGVWIVLDLLTPVLLYGGAAVVTTPERDVRTRERVVPAGPVGWIDERFDADSRLSLPLLPPAYPKNLRFVVPTLLLLLVPVLGVGGALTVDGWAVGRRGAGAPVTALFEQFVVFGRPVVAVVGAVVVLAQAGRFYRCHVATGRYERWTTHMMLELQVTYTLLYAFGVVLFVLYAMLLLVIVGLGVGTAVGDATGSTTWLVLVLTTGVAVKFAFEWSRVRGERRRNVGVDSFTANFAPTPPDRAERAREPRSDRVDRSTDP